MENFAKAWQYVRQNEGGYSNHKSDRGGESNYGVSLRFLRSVGLGDGDINCDGQINGEDIRLLPESTAQSLYKTYFWNSANCESIENSRVAVKFFDMCVNFGVNTASKIMQKALNNISSDFLLIDGLIGPKSLEKINKADPDALLRELVRLTSQEYREIIENSPSQQKFLKGWLSRAERVPV